MRPTIAQINLTNLAHNVKVIRNHLPPAMGMTAVVKADAYGHGALAVSRVALDQGATSLAVATPEEGIELREAGFTVPILLLGLTFPEDAKNIITYGLTATACTFEQINHLAQVARTQNRQAKVMLKMDTGMNRIGFAPQDLLRYAEYALSFAEIDLRGCFTHLATADSNDKQQALNQVELFRQSLEQLADKQIHLPYISFANSASIVDLDCSLCNHVRPGIILYGLAPSNKMQRKLDLKPVMELKTKVVYVKQVPAGAAIGYGRTFTATHATYIATLPIGYADGYHRLLSNKAAVLIGGKRCPLVGTVCMDQIMVDLGPDFSGEIGAEAVLFGRQGTAEITVDELADLAQTINYELVCAISKRVPRIYCS
jgi:alanine racemase